MNSEIRKNYLEAGKIASASRNLALKITKEGKPYIEIVETIENFIKEKGAQPAFPVNISVNEIAAHFTPLKSDALLINESDLIKIDVGVHVNGCIADTAISINLDNSHSKLIECSREALDEVLSMLKPDIELKGIGKTVQKIINSHGFLPVKNLGGHTLEQWLTHAGIFIPNVHTTNVETLEKGMVFAIEPFATSGSGYVKESKGGNIYKYECGNVRSPQERSILQTIIMNYKTLPFTSRWFNLSEAQAKLYLTRMVLQNVIHHYPILKEAGNGPVSQAEHTILMDDEPIVITE